MYAPLRALRSTKRLLVPALILLCSALFSLSISVSKASAACTALPTDKGTVTSTVTVPADGTYRVWSRIQSAVSTNNSFYMQIDQTSCNIVVGGASLTANTWTWVDYQSGTTTNKFNATLTAGTHTITMAGKDDGVEVDRVILTQDTSCVPTGTGDNCANPPDTTPPVVSITAPANNATISTTTTATASATDDVAVAKVEFYLDGALVATDTTSPYTYSIVPTSLSVGSHNLVAKAYDTAATPNTATSSTVNFTVPDTTPPTISGISTGSITQTSASVNWTTNEASDSQIDYGTTTGYGTSTTLNTSLVTTHGVNVSGLSANTLYHYRVKSKDAAGNLATSADGTFTTLAPAGDTTKPTVSLTAPATGATVSGTVTVTATASDNVGVVGVQFKLDGANLNAEDTGTPYTTSWNTTGVANGSHTLTAVARDAAGNTQTATTITVTVNNAGSFAAADINQDGHVNLQDFSLLVGSTFPRSGAGLGRADINGDGSVNLQDFSLLVGSTFPR